jgi:hypothetical protein
MALEKIISGGQTGVDRAALDAALDAGFPCGGWAPLGRQAEDGVIPCRYPLDECGRGGYEERTRLNVRDSGATLVLTLGKGPATLGGGTLLTLEWAEKLSKPYLVVDLDQAWDPDGVGQWLQGADISVLNVAGPRESTAPGIYQPAVDFITAVLAVIQPRF